MKSLVELHEGSISLKSQLGVGSEFIVSLPVRSKNNIENTIIKEKSVMN